MENEFETNALQAAEKWYKIAQFRSDIRADLKSYYEGYKDAGDRINELEIKLESLKTYEPKKYDPTFGDDKECECGHSYHRHFDSYEEMDPVGCKYCGCYEFKVKSDN